MKNFLIVTAVIFIVLAVVFYVMNISAPQFQFAALEVANLLMALLAVSTCMIIRKQMNGRPQAFVRGISSASFLKLMVCMVAILIYILLNRTHIHKPSVFVMFGVYAVYTVAETILLSKMARE